MRPATPTMRRRNDRRGHGRVAVAVRSLIARLDAASGGIFLLALTGTGVAAATPLLAPTKRDLFGLLGVSVAMAALLTLSRFVDWRRLPRAATLAFPVGMFAAFAALSVVAPGLTGSLTGLLIGAYVYTGLTQRPGASLIVVPLGCTTFVAMAGGLSHAVAVRVLIAGMVGATIVEILAAFTAQQQRLSDALVRAAMSDSLTGLPNRRDLERRLGHARPGDSVVVCDLDHFKRLNDTRGHHVGDQVLADFGDLLRAELREGDYGARYGGEEFVLLLPDTAPHDALALTGRLRTAWRLRNSTTTFSAGIAACLAERDIAASLAAADAALYAAKAAGRDTDRLEADKTDLPRRVRHLDGDAGHSVTDTAFDVEDRLPG